jgi:cobyrinic acid a,c-diamide synthase
VNGNIVGVTLNAQTASPDGEDRGDAIESGLPVYAECGGLMYLARSLTVGGCAYQMVGALPGDAVMHRRAIGRGYVELEPTGDAPWSAGAAPRSHYP